MPRLKKRADGRYQRRKTINGKSILFYGKSAQEIEAKIAEYEKRVNAPATFAQIAQEWYNDGRDKLSFTTQKGYETAYIRAVEHFGDTLAADITAADVYKWLKEFINQGYALKTIAKHKGIVSIIYEAAKLRGDADHNPAKGWALDRGLPRTPRKAPSDEVIDKIISTDDPWIFPRIMVLAGLRPGEARALTYEDIDFESGTITVNKQILFNGNTPVLVNHTKTKAGNRVVPLPDALAAVIPRGKKGRMFDLDYRHFRNEWSAYCERIGIGHVTPHQLRHAYASILLDADVKEKDAQQIMGHADIRTTQNIYQHILESRETRNAKQINDYLNTRKKVL